MKNLIFSISVLFVTLNNVKAQHYSLFSQYMVNGLVINPAYAGKDEALDASALHRKQWTNMDGAPQTSAFSISSSLRNKSTNAGLVFQDDRLGVSASQYLSGVYAYRITFGRVNMSFGVQAGMLLNKTRWDALRSNDAGDHLLQTTSTRTGFFAGAGLYAYNQKFYAGLSSPLLFESVTKSLRQPLLLTGGVLLKVSNDHSLKPSVLLRYLSAKNIQADLNCMYYYKSLFGAGASYRNRESVVLVGEFFVGDQFRISYSYDAGINRLASYHSGSHELMLRYILRYVKKAVSPRAFYF